MEYKKSSKRIIITANNMKKSKQQLLGKADLDIMLYKLKNYYDFIQIMKENKKKKMEDLNFKYDTYDQTVKEVHNLGNIEVEQFNQPFKVSILNSKTTKESKESIQEK